MANQKFVGSHPILPEPVDSITRFEGMFKPGTYQIAANRLHPKDSVYDQQKALHNAREIIGTLLKESAAHFSSLDESNGLTPYQKVTLASIVEKEAVKNQSYDSITSVFCNRIERNYPLASCVTVEYVLGYHRSFLTFNDINTESPYNLYANTGLTPTPVCFVSPEALAAAQNPIKTDLRYFVYDWTDHTISFATTHSVHDINSNVARNNFIKKFGKKELRKKYYGNFYEPIDSLAN